MENKIERILQNNTVTLASAILALGSLITLVFTSLDDLFPIHQLLKLKENIQGLNHLNFFLWFDSIVIPYVISIVILVLVILGVYPRYLSILHSWVTYTNY